MLKSTLQLKETGESRGHSMEVRSSFFSPGNVTLGFHFASSSLWTS